MPNAEPDITETRAPRCRLASIAALLCALLAGAGCDTCGRALDPDPVERQAERYSERLRSSEGMVGVGYDNRARQQAADRYRDRIVPGFGCDYCPSYCKLVDLRPIEHEEYARQLRQVLIDARSDNGVTRATSVIEHNRLTCMLEIHESMSTVLEPLMHPRESPRVRFEAAFNAIIYELPAGDPVQVLYELAEGTDRVARRARALIFVWDRDGWPSMSPMRDAGI